MRIDLHTHTYFSDGSFSPSEVVKLAIERKVEYLAITDHDVITGVAEAQKFAARKKINLIPGIEITSQVKCSDKEVHIIGLFLNLNNPSLKFFSENIHKVKIEKVKHKLEKLNSNLSTKVTLEDLKKKTKGAPSSAHIWMVLVDKGLAKDIKEARDIAIKYGTIPEDSSINRISAEDAIKIIHGAGGLAVLAHLSAYKNENKFVTLEEQEVLIKELTECGLDGLEIYIPDANKEDIAFGEKMVKKYNLKISGGSDFHDEKFIPQNKIGFLDTNKNKISILT